jgi:hypothetical protein
MDNVTISPRTRREPKMPETVKPIAHGQLDEYARVCAEYARVGRRRKELRSALLAQYRAGGGVIPGPLALDITEREFHSLSRSSLTSVFGRLWLEKVLAAIPATVEYVVAVVEAVREPRVGERLRPDARPRGLKIPHDEARDGQVGSEVAQPLPYSHDEPESGASSEASGHEAERAGNVAEMVGLPERGHQCRISQAERDVLEQEAAGEYHRVDQAPVDVALARIEQDDWPSRTGTMTPNRGAGYRSPRAPIW